MRNKDKLPRGRNIDARKVVKEAYVYVILILVVVVLTLIKGEVGQRGNFLFWPNIAQILRASVPVIMVSAAFTFIFITGNIDLSVGSTVSLSVVFYSILVLNGFGFLPALLLTMVLGAVLGGINGLLVMQLRITPVIATLITMSAYQGVARYLVPKGISAIKSGDVLKMPEWMSDFSRQGIVDAEVSKVFKEISWAIIIAIIVIVILVIVQKRTVLGKYMSAVGGNRTAAELSGINAKKVVWGVYILIGVVTSLAGVIRSSNMSIGDPYTGIGLETEAIIACLLGGTVFTGGEGSVVKSVVGAIIIVFLTLGLKQIIDPYYQTLVKGIVLVLAVALNHVLTRERKMAQ